MVICYFKHLQRLKIKADRTNIKQIRTNEKVKTSTKMFSYPSLGSKTISRGIYPPSTRTLLSPRGEITETPTDPPIALALV